MDSAQLRPLAAVWLVYTQVYALSIHCRCCTVASIVHPASCVVFRRDASAAMCIRILL